MTNQPGIEWHTAGEMTAVISAVRMLVLNQYRLQNGEEPLDVLAVLSALKQELERETQSDLSPYMKEYMEGRNTVLSRLSEIPAQES